MTDMDQMYAEKNLSSSELKRGMIYGSAQQIWMRQKKRNIFGCG
jgi:hypothetical protein